MLHCHNARTVRLFSWITAHCWNKDLRFSYRLNAEALRHYFLFWTVQEFITLWWPISLKAIVWGQRTNNKAQITCYWSILVYCSLFKFLYSNTILFSYSSNVCYVITTMYKERGPGDDWLLSDFTKTPGQLLVAANL